MKFSQKDLLNSKTYDFLITEKAYKVPSTFQQLFFDTYALYDLYWRFGKGKSNYGYKHPADVLPGNLNDKVDYMFEEAVHMIAKLMIIGMSHIIAGEAENAEDDLWVNQDELSKWLIQNNMDFLMKDGFYKNPNPREIISGKPSFDTMGYFFSAPFWKSKKSKWFKLFGGEEYVSPETGKIQRYDVGGESWSKIANLSQKLLNFYRKNDTIKTMETLDHIFHIHHNNGSIFNKIELLKLNIRLNTSDLDYRRDARSIDDFKGKVSTQVENLINATTRIR